MAPYIHLRIVDKTNFEKKYPHDDAELGLNVYCLQLVRSLRDKSNESFCTYTFTLSLSLSHTQTQTQTHAQTHRHTHTRTDTQTQTHTYTYKHTHRQRIEY